MSVVKSGLIEEPTNELVLGVVLQAKWLETAVVQLRTLNLAMGIEPMTSVLESLPGLFRFSDALQNLYGFGLICRPEAVLDRDGKTRREDVAHCDLSGFSALRSLFIRTDHARDLRLPSTLTFLEIDMHVGNAGEVGGPKAGPGMMYRVQELSLGWPVFLQGGSRIRALRLNVFQYNLDYSIRGMAGWRSVRESLDLYRKDLQDFQQNWPQGLHLRKLSALRVYMPFELAVQHAELLHFSWDTMFVTAATSAEGVLKALLEGRARKLCVYSNGKSPGWVGPALCGGGKLGLSEVEKAARSGDLASRVKVENFKHGSRLCSVVFTVTSRWMGMWRAAGALSRTTGGGC